MTPCECEMLRALLKPQLFNAPDLMHQVPVGCARMRDAVAYSSRILCVKLISRLSVTELISLFHRGWSSRNYLSLSFDLERFLANHIAHILTLFFFFKSQYSYWLGNVRRKISKTRPNVFGLQLRKATDINKIDSLPQLINPTSVSTESTNDTSLAQRRRSLHAADPATQCSVLRCLTMVMRTYIYRTYD